STSEPRHLRRNPSPGPSTPGRYSRRVTAFENRLAKNWRHFSRWASRRGLEAFRVYDRDMPEFPWAVDRYGDAVVASWYPPRKQRSSVPLEQELDAIRRTLSAEPIVKVHAPKVWGKEQYGRQARRGQTRIVTEDGLKLEVNLFDFLDTGLFLDHRNTRARVR